MKRSFVCFAVPKPANCRIVQSLPRYPVGWTPRVYGYSPGQPRSRSKSKPGCVSGPASGSTGAPETVVQSFFQGGAFESAFATPRLQRSRPAATAGGTRGSFSLMRE